MNKIILLILLISCGTKNAFYHSQRNFSTKMIYTLPYGELECINNDDYFALENTLTDKKDSTWSLVIRPLVTDNQKCIGIWIYNWYINIIPHASGLVYYQTFLKFDSQIYLLSRMNLTDRLALFDTFYKNHKKDIGKKDWIEIERIFKNKGLFSYSSGL